MGRRLTGGSITLDGEVGHPIKQHSLSGGTITFEAASPIKQ